MLSDAMANEQLYRRGEDGIMEKVVVPEARGKAAAFDRWLAQGGKPFRVSGRFKEGPMKGLTYDQAKQKFETMWASSPDALKEKYAGRAKTDLAPSERLIPGMSPTGPAVAKDMSAAGVQKRRMAFYGHEKTADGTVQRIGTPARAKQVTPPPGSDEARAAALTANSRNERFATADNGDQAMKAAVAMSDGRPMRDAFDLTNYTGKPVSAPVEKTPIERAVDGALDANTRFWDRTTTAVNSAISAPFTPPSEQIVGNESEAARRTLEAKRIADAEAAQQRITQENAARLRAEKGLQSPSMAVTAPVAANPPASTPTHVSSTVSPTGKTPSIAPANVGSEAPTGRPVMGDAPKGVNRLTGLPMGHLPGDALPQKFAGDRQMQSRAADSLVRQQFAEPIPPRAIPVMQPSPKPTALSQSGINRPRTVGADTLEGRAAAEMRRQAAINANPSKVNPYDPKKFFTGRTLPLDQLVKRQKLQGIGTPARL